MADCVTSLYVKNVDIEKFKKWFEKETDSWPYYDTVEGWDLYASIEEGYGGYFYESLALKMIEAFKEIIFECGNQIIFDDHIVGTLCKCNGKEVILKRYIELPNNYNDEIDEEYKEELEDMRSFLEAENDVPYFVNFSVEEVISCSEVYGIVGKKLKDGALVEATCAEHSISKGRFLEFANIFNFKKRK